MGTPAGDTDGAGTRHHLRSAGALLDRLWEETLRHRALDLLLAFTLSAAVTALAVSQLAGVSGSESGAPPTTTSKPQGPTRAYRYAPLVVAPLDAPGVPGVAADGRIGGLVKTVPSALSRQEEIADTFSEVAAGSPRPLLRVGLLLDKQMTGRRTPVEAAILAFLCDPTQRAVDVLERVREGAAVMEAQLLFGVIGNYERATCGSYRPGQMPRLLQLLRSEGAIPVVRGYTSDSTDPAIADLKQSRSDLLQVVAPSVPRDPGQPMRRPDDLPEGTVLVADMRLLRERRPATGPRSAGSERALLLEAARAGSDVFLYLDSKAGWSQAADILEQLAREDPTIKRSLDDALVSVRRRWPDAEVGAGRQAATTSAASD